MELARPDLTPDQCWELLTVAHVGRLALSVRALPMIFPVRYAVDGDSVAISLGRHGLPAASVHDAVVAFAVDEIDPSAGVGWMVQMQGRARLFDTDQAPVDPEAVAIDGDGGAMGLGSGRRGVRIHGVGPAAA